MNKNPPHFASMQELVKAFLSPDVMPHSKKDRTLVEADLLEGLKDQPIDLAHKALSYWISNFSDLPTSYQILSNMRAIAAPKVLFSLSNQQS